MPSVQCWNMDYQVIWDVCEWAISNHAEISVGE